MRKTRQFILTKFNPRAVNESETDEVSWPSYVQGTYWCASFFLFLGYTKAWPLPLRLVVMHTKSFTRRTLKDWTASASSSLVIIQSRALCVAQADLQGTATSPSSASQVLGFQAWTTPSNTVTLFLTLTLRDEMLVNAFSQNIYNTNFFLKFWTWNSWSSQLPYMFA